MDVEGIIKFYGTANISFGINVSINSKYSANPIGGQGFTSFTTLYDGNIVIGNNVGISNSAFFSMCGIVVGDNVLIGGGCKIYDTDFHSIDYSERISTPDYNIKKSSVYIKEGAFIGANCIILKGVTVGVHAVVGAGSVVTKDVPDGEIWGGNPAKFIRKVK